MNEPARLPTGLRDCTFGKGCVVADCVNVYSATFGDECFIGPYVEIQNDVTVGNNVRIHSHSLICEGMTIGNDVFVGHGVMTANSRFPRAGAKDWKCEPPQIGNGVSIGSNASILPGVVIGDGAVIGAGAVISKAVPAGATVIGQNQILPAKS